ncbi:TlpA family protein disulfide reductase [Aquihabitans sp. G128]|uniref:TlpA family protein disulfide reductase n=1 Tax=Aquihabitans sp. G128 TaxID=2849779 RepID=UPI001C229B98|nr:TlpA disulfide reductase family protein [Aquihabitans sp. G128]QXC60950.1 TlpA family protein disulfide reductase [Aquihabitans sp. G128]
MTAPAAAPVRPKRSRPTLIAAVVVGVVIALLVVLLATRHSGERVTESNLIGKRAPALDGDVVRGQPVDLGTSEGWTVVNFFATWCVPCIQEHPELKAFEKEHAAKGDAQVVSVVYDDKASDVDAFFEKNGGDWTVLGSDQGRTAFYWGVAKVPESYLVSPTGVVVERFVGGVTRTGLNSLIDLYEKQAGGS